MATIIQEYSGDEKAQQKIEEISEGIYAEFYANCVVLFGTSLKKHNEKDFFMLKNKTINETYFQNILQWLQSNQSIDFKVKYCQQNIDLCCFLQKNGYIVKVFPKIGACLINFCK
jgi:hypothetical protein